MSSHVRHRRSNTPGAVPPASMEPGEVAVNTADGKLFISGGGPAIEVLGVRLHLASASYAAGEAIVHGNKTLFAKTALAPKAFDPTDWLSETDQALGNVVRPHDAGLAYAAGQAVVHNARLLFAKTDLAPKAFAAADWTDNIADTQALIAVTFHDPAKSYAAGDAVVHGTRLLFAKAALAPKAFDAADWEDEVKHTRALIAVTFHDPAKSYAAGDAVVHGTRLLFAKAALAPKAFDAADWTDARMHDDGTLAAPGMSFLSEPGTGWYRRGAGQITLASQGGQVLDIDAGTAALSFLSLIPRSHGQAVVALSNNAAAADYNITRLIQNADGSSELNATPQGTATNQPMRFIGGLSYSFDANVAIAGNVLTVGSQGNGLALVDTGPTRMMRFTQDNWRLEFATATGALTYHNPANQALLMVAGNGDLTINGAAATKASGTTWANPSDERIKANVRDYTEGLAEVLRLRPVLHDYRAETGLTETDSVSLIAQEAQQVMPRMVTTKPGKVGELAFDDLHVLDTSPLVFALVNAVKELSAQNVELRARIGALEAKA